MKNVLQDRKYSHRGPPINDGELPDFRGFVNGAMDSEVN